VLESLVSLLTFGHRTFAVICALCKTASTHSTAMDSPSGDLNGTALPTADSPTQEKTVISFASTAEPSPTLNNSTAPTTFSDSTRPAARKLGWNASNLMNNLPIVLVAVAIIVLLFLVFFSSSGSDRATLAQALILLVGSALKNGTQTLMEQ